MHLCASPIITLGFKLIDGKSKGFFKTQRTALFHLAQLRLVSGKIWSVFCSWTEWICIEFRNKWFFWLDNNGLHRVNAQSLDFLCSFLEENFNFWKFLWWSQTQTREIVTDFWRILDLLHFWILKTDFVGRILLRPGDFSLDSGFTELSFFTIRTQLF
jgi:hypothetical protein